MLRTLVRWGRNMGLASIAIVALLFIFLGAFWLFPVDGPCGLEPGKHGHGSWFSNEIECR